MTERLPIAGWYADGNVVGRMRWWNGQRWTQHTWLPHATPTGGNVHVTGTTALPTSSEMGAPAVTRASAVTTVAAASSAPAAPLPSSTAAPAAPATRATTATRGPRGLPDGRPMNPVQATGSLFRNYARFRGYASRSEFWFAFLFLTLLAVTGWIIDASGGLGVVSTLLWLATLLPGLAVSVRRLRDAGFGWGWAVLVFVPVVDVVLLILWALPRERRATPAASA